MQVKIKKLSPEAVLPKYAKPGDAGCDIVATSIEVSNKYIEYGTGLSVEVPEGYVMLLFPRSSVSAYDLTLANSVGVLDSGYRGEIKFRFKTSPCQGIPDIYRVGDKIGQIMIIPYPKIEYIEVDELSSTDRGTGGFGSTN